MKDAIEELIAISKYAGMREDLVQAGGGNSSVKLDDTRMLIKASGIQMADISVTGGYSTVAYPKIRRFMDALAGGEDVCDAGHALEAALIAGKRPSIETFLHAIAGRVTLHTHPVSINVLTARHDGMQTLKELFPDSLLVGYATPGLELAKLYYQAFLKERGGVTAGFPTVFLKNHGLIVSGESAEEVIAEMERITKTVERSVGMDNGAYRTGYEIFCFFRDNGFHDGKVVVKAESETVLGAFRRNGYTVWNYRTCPDCIVFCGKAPFAYDGPQSAEKLPAFCERYGEPVLIQTRDALYIRADSVRKAREIESVLAYSARVAQYNLGSEMDSLSAAEQSFLLTWDAEKYRREMK